MTENSNDGIAPLAAFVAGLEPGERNKGLFWASCRAAEDGLGTRPLAKAAAEAGLDPVQARRTIASAKHTIAEARKEHGKLSS